MGVRETIVAVPNGYVQDDSMDKKVLYQNFGFFVPMPTTDDDPVVPYNIMADAAPWFADVGITDLWMAPPYKTLAANPYHEGYAAIDRYDLGEFAQGSNNLIRTKYGTKEQLLNCISTFNDYGIRCLADLVPNQQYMADERVVKVSACQQDGTFGGIPDNYMGFMYNCYVTGAGPGQIKYGQLKYWDVEQMNGTDGQGMGRYRVLADNNGVGTPYTWLSPGMTVYLKSWNDVPYFGWSPSNASTVDANTGKTLVNVIVEDDTFDNYNYEIKTPQGKTITIGYELLEGTYVPDWFIQQLLYYVIGGYSPIAVQTMEDEGYLVITGGFIQYVAFLPYALWSNDFPSSEINETFMNYCIAELDETTITTGDEFVAWLRNAGPTKVGNWMSSWAAAQPAFNGETEGYAAFMIQKSDNSQEHDVDRNVIQYEFLIGTDVDNSRSDVQSETTHWAKWLLSLGFQGFRVDAGDHVNWDLHYNNAATMYSTYGDEMNDHIVVMECYVPYAYEWLSAANYPAAGLDAPQWGAFQSELAYPWSSSNLANVVTESMAYPERVTAGATIPVNWSFVMNHDQEKTILTSDYTITDGSTGNAGENNQFNQYNYDRKIMNKDHAWRNVPTMYAIMLTNKGTIPTVYYGDLYYGNLEYMSSKTPYFNVISMLLRMRKRYVSGDQSIQFYVSNTSTQAGKDLIASIRSGTTRDTGIAVVYGNNVDLFVKISVPMGTLHANQTYRNIMAIGDEYAQTDANGNLPVWVSGEQSVFVYGYLSVWIPV